MAHAAIYLRIGNFDLADAFEPVATGRNAEGRVTHFDVVVGGEHARFNVMPKAELSGHLAGFQGWIEPLNEPKKHKAHALQLIRETKSVLGLVAENEFEHNPALWGSLFQIADIWNGFVFVYDSILLPNGEVVVGPLRQES